jgi:hypothetical protein
MRRRTPRQLRKALDAAQTPEFAPSIQSVTLRDRMDRGSFTAVGWIAPTTLLSRDGWLAVGDAITALERATPWLWGDWWRAGVAVPTLPPDWQGPARHTLENYAGVARRFPHSRRRESVSFKHHAELAALPHSEQEKWLDQCDKPKRLSVTALRRLIKPPSPPAPPITVTPEQPL